MGAEWFPDPNSPFQEKATVSVYALYVRHAMPGFTTWTVFSASGRLVRVGWAPTSQQAKEQAVAAALKGVR